MSIVRSVGFGTFIKLFNWTWSAWPEYWCFSWLEVGDQLGFSVRQEFPTSSWHSGFSKHFPRRSRRRWDCYLDFANHGGMRILSSSRPLDKPMLDGNLYSGGFIFSISFCYSNFQSTEDIFSCVISLSLRSRMLAIFGKPKFLVQFGIFYTETETTNFRYFHFRHLTKIISIKFKLFKLFFLIYSVLSSTYFVFELTTWYWRYNQI